MRTTHVSVPRLQISLLIAVAAIAFFYNCWVSEDAYITFRVIDNFLNGFGLRWNIAERVQVFTHPLWLILLIPIVSVTKSVYLSSLVLSAICYLTLFWLFLSRIDGFLARSLFVFGLVYCRSFLDYSSSGLENALLALLCAGLYFCNRTVSGVGRYRLWGLSIALLFLTRPDSLLFTLPWFVIDELSAPNRRQFLRNAKILAIFALPAALWLAFATIYYGTPLPNTALAKTAHQLPVEEMVAQGLHYLEAWAQFDPCGALLALVSVVAMAQTKRNYGLLGGFLIFVLYIVSVGGDYMAGRFLSFPMPIMMFIVLESIQRRSLRIRWVVGIMFFGIMLLQTARGFCPFVYNPYFENPWRDSRGIEDHRGFYYKSNGLLGKWHIHSDDVAFLADGKSTRLQLAEIERNVGKPAAITQIVCNVGAVGFAVGPNDHIIDPFAITDPLLSRLPSYPFFRPGHFERLIPVGYARAVALNDDSVMDPDIRRLWRVVKLVTRSDDYFSIERLRAIWTLNTKSSNFWLASSQYLKSLGARKDEARVLGCIDPHTGLAPITVNASNIDMIGAWKPAYGVTWLSSEFRIHSH